MSLYVLDTDHLTLLQQDFGTRRLVILQQAVRIK